MRLNILPIFHQYSCVMSAVPDKLASISEAKESLDLKLKTSQSSSAVCNETYLARSGWEVNPLVILPDLLIKDVIMMQSVVKEISFYVKKSLSRDVTVSEKKFFQSQVVIALKYGGIQRVKSLITKFKAWNRELKIALGEVPRNGKVAKSSSGLKVKKWSSVAGDVETDHLCNLVRKMAIRSNEV